MSRFITLLVFVIAVLGFQVKAVSANVSVDAAHVVAADGAEEKGKEAKEGEEPECD